MRDDLERLLGQTSLVVVALAIAIGWSLFQMAKGVADLVTGLFTRYPSSSDAAVAAHFQPATWVVGQRVVTFGSLIAGVVELAVALVVAGWIVRRGRTA